MQAQWWKQSVHSAGQGDHQSHLHQRMELLEEDVCAVCSAVVLPIALSTTPLWDIYGAEGKREQVQSQDQGQQLNLGQRRMNWSTEMQSQEQYERCWVKEVSGSAQVVVQKH